MKRQYLLPDPGEGLLEAEVVAWRVAEGDVIEVNDVLVEIETAKSLVELPSPWRRVTVTRLIGRARAHHAPSMRHAHCRDRRRSRRCPRAGRVGPQPGRLRRLRLRPGSPTSPRPDFAGGASRAVRGHVQRLRPARTRASARRGAPCRCSACPSHRRPPADAGQGAVGVAAGVGVGPGVVEGPATIAARDARRVTSVDLFHRSSAP